MVASKEMPKIVIAIDGPAGSGKSSAGKAIARRLKIPYVDTGAMYRAVAYRAQVAGIALSDEAALGELAGRLHIEFLDAPEKENRIIVDGKDLSDAIRTPEISQRASDVAVVSSVRRALVEKQRELIFRQGGVLEGRDAGTVICPETPHKFFLTADASTRAKRRLKDLEAAGVETSYEEVFRAMEARDHQDSTRKDAPLRQASDADLVDSTQLDFDQVVERIVLAVQDRRRV